MTARLTQAERNEILTLARDGIPRRAIADQTGRAPSTITKVCSAAGVKLTRSSTSPDTGRPDKRVRSTIDTAEKMRQVVDLRRQRWTYQRIADELGHSKQWVAELYERAVAEIPAGSVHLHRAEMLDQLDEAEAAVLEVLHARHVVVSNGHVVSEIVGHHPLVDDSGEAHPKGGEPIYGDPLIDHGPVLDAARTLVALQARRAKLVGADAPVELKSSETVTHYFVALGDDDAAKAALT